MTRQLALVIQHHLISSGWNLDPVAPETFHCCRRGLRPGAAVVPMQQWRSHAGVLHTNIANCPGSFNLTTPTARWQRTARHTMLAAKRICFTPPIG